MKRYEGETWHVRDLRNSSELGNICSCPRNLEECRQLIDDTNKRVMQRGYNPEQYLICCCKWYSCYDDENCFLESGKSTKVIEKYPKEL